MKQPKKTLVPFVKPEALGDIHRDAMDLGRDLERARARAIINHFFGKDWSGNDALKMLDSGKWPAPK